MGANEYGDQVIRSTSCQWTNRKPKAHIDLDGLMNSCSRTELNDALKCYPLALFFNFLPGAQVQCISALLGIVMEAPLLSPKFVSE